LADEHMSKRHLSDRHLAVFDQQAFGCI